MKTASQRTISQAFWSARAQLFELFKCLVLFDLFYELCVTYCEKHVSSGEVFPCALHLTRFYYRIGSYAFEIVDLFNFTIAASSGVYMTPRSLICLHLYNPKNIYIAPSAVQ